MADNYWKQVLEKAQSDRDTLWNEWRESIARAQGLLERVVQLDKTITSLKELVGEDDSAADEVTKRVDADDLVDLKLADACRVLFKANPAFLKPTDIRDILGELGYDLRGYSNPLAAIHGVLKRMAESGELLRADVGGDTMYRWNFTKEGKWEDSPLGKALKHELGLDEK